MAPEDVKNLHRTMIVSPDNQWFTMMGICRAMKTTREVEVQIRSLNSGKVTATMPLTDSSRGIYSTPMSAMAFSPDGKTIVVATTADDGIGPIDVYDIATGRHAARIERKGDSASGARGRLAFTPDGQQIVAPETDSTAAVWEWKRFLIEE